MKVSHLNIWNNISNTISNGMMPSYHLMVALTTITTTLSTE